MERVLLFQERKKLTKVTCNTVGQKPDYGKCLVSDSEYINGLGRLKARTFFYLFTFSNLCLAFIYYELRV